MKVLTTTFLVLIVLGTASGQTTPFTNLDVFELEWVSDPQISPDGSQIVYVRGGMDIMKDRRKSSLWIITSNGGNHSKLTSLEANESQPVWSPDGSRIAFVASTEQGGEIYVYWLDTQKIARISQLERSPRGLRWSPDGQRLSFSMHVPESAPILVKPPKKPKGAEWAEHPRVETRLKHEADGSGYMEPGYSHIFIVPAIGGYVRQVSSGDFHHRAPAEWTKDGKSLIFSSNRNKNWELEFRNSELYSLNSVTGQINALTDRDGPDGNPKVSPDGKRIAYLGFDDRVQTYQISRLYLMNIDGSGKREVSLKLDRSISDIQWSTDGKGIYFSYDDKGNSKVGYTTLTGKVSTLVHNLGGDAIGRPYGGGGYSVSVNGDIAFNTTRPEHPAELSILKQGNSDPIQLTSLNQSLLEQRKLGQVEEIWFKSSFDNRDIQGWIVKPYNFDPSKKYPLLVENHGGPIANYGDRFSPEMQLFAADGIVVFYPNPRGSTSYGEEFGNLLYHNYPGNDYDDVMSGVDAMLAKGYISEDSLFVTGGSAGGIMTAWMIGKNNRFRAAVVVKPIMNWMSKTLVADNYFGYANSRFPGQPWENPEIYIKYSPISLVGNIQTPTLVMVGTSDLRTPSSEAKQLYHALKLRNIDTALVEIWGSYHFISNRPSQLITKTDHILAWLRKYR